MEDSKELTVLLMRINRLKEELDLKVPSVILKNEIRLIKQACDSILEETDCTEVDEISKTLAGVELVWRGVPQLRLGQLIANVVEKPYYLENDDLLDKLNGFYTECKEMN